MCKKLFSTRFFSFLCTLMMCMSFIALMPTTTTHAYAVDPNDANYMASAWGIAKTRLDVYDYDKNIIGAIAAGEGFTAIGTEIIGLPGQSGLMINYSTPSGAKTGMIYDDNYTNTLYTLADYTCAGTVNYNATVYYGKATNNYQTVGSVSSGEFVSVLAESNNMCYIEYNTNVGRKRGWCSSSAITKHKCVFNPNMPLGALPCNASAINANRTYSHRTVYSGPSNKYFTVGSIGTATSSETVYVVAQYTYNGETWAYISYSTSTKNKSGYIKIS